VQEQGPHGRRGRPRKFDRPSHLVALTLPDEVVNGLRRVHPDLAWAVVSLFEKRPPGETTEPPPDFELLQIADSRSLIVVNRSGFKRLPGVDVVPLSADRAFLALPPDRGLSDLELAVVDRLEMSSVKEAEREALQSFREQLRKWRHDRSLTFRSRSIIVVESRQRKNSGA
jgi:hypothetical protein